MARLKAPTGIVHEPTYHKTSIGSWHSKCKVNKRKMLSYTAYRGQGR